MARHCDLLCYIAHMCGVVGLIGAPEAAKEAFLGLTTLQHRGQDAAGILTYDQSGFHLVKNIGLVDSVFTRDHMSHLTGHMAIGHARYSTIGRGEPQGELGEVQPFFLNYPFGLGMAHNGNVVNCSELREDLKTQSRRHLLTRSDTEAILNLFADGLAKASSASASVAGSSSSPTPTLNSGSGSALRSSSTSGLHSTSSSDLSSPSNSVSAIRSGSTSSSGLQPFEAICSAVQKVFESVNGSYSIVTLIADQGLVAFRDPYGIRPLVWGRRKETTPLGSKESQPQESHMIASESVALSFLGYESIRDVQPGEVVFIDTQGQVHTRVIDQRGFRHCMFEWVYFASPESVIDRIPVYNTRNQLGKNLADLVREQMRARGIEADIVAPVPETSRIAAIALAEELKIPYREVLIKNRYIKRTFILDSQEKRQKAVNLKLSPVRSEIEGKRILLVDDSIVRGTTSRKIIDLVRKAGASKIYFVSTCPPIRYPCYYGIDFPVQSELIASGRDSLAIEKELGADAVIYQSWQGLEQSLVDKTTKNATLRPCMACLNGQYVTDVSQATESASTRCSDRGERADRPDRSDRSDRLDYKDT